MCNTLFSKRCKNNKFFFTQMIDTRVHSYDTAFKKASSYRTQAKWLDVMFAFLSALMSRDAVPHHILPLSLVAVSITADSPQEHPHRGFVAAPLQTPSSDSINRLYILPKTTSCDCDRLTETTPRFYKNNSLVWNFKTIHHLCVIDQVYSIFHSYTVIH
jgi:hypothetical protein